jgi:hypothetical protein
MKKRKIKNKFVLTEFIKNNIKLLYFGIISYFVVASLSYKSIYKPKMITYEFIFILFIVFIIFTIPLVTFYLYSFKDKKRIIGQSLIFGLITWIYIRIPFELIIILISNDQLGRIYFLFQFVFGGYLIFKFNLSRAFIWLVLFLGIYANLFLLIRIYYLHLKKNISIKR